MSGLDPIWGEVFATKLASYSASEADDSTVSLTACPPDSLPWPDRRALGDPMWAGSTAWEERGEGSRLLSLACSRSSTAGVRPQLTRQHTCWG